ncbi:RHS repeat-associated core domain-containing protein [Luteimonas pelagia]
MSRVESVQNLRGLAEQVTDAISGNRILDDTLAYDSVGNLLAITDGATGQQQVGNRDLTYDGLDRLTQAYSPMFGAGGLATYTYDVQDNLTGVSIGSRNHAYHYDDGTNRLTSVKDVATGSTVAGLAYDAQGNIANKNGRTFDFDYGNRLRSIVGLESYLYDGHGRRAMSTTAAGRILSHYGFDGRLYYQYDERAKRKVEYFYLGSQLVAQRSRPIPGTAETFEYHHTDALGSSVAVTDSSSTPWLSVRRSKYEPYGALIDRANDDRPGYTGHVMDSATGLTYMQQRYYDAEIGLFLSVDSVAPALNPVTHFNRYRYANGNPTTLVDPDGRSALTKLVKLAVNGGDFAQTVSGVVDDFRTLTNPQASVPERIMAGVALASEAAPVSIGDIKDAVKGGKAIVDRVSAGADRAVREGRASTYRDSTRGSSVANRETNASRESMQENLSSAGYSSSTSQDGTVTVMTNGEKSYVFRTDKPSVDFKPGGDGRGKPVLKIRPEKD